MVGRWVASVGHLIQFSFGVATAVIATQKGPNRKSENARAVLTGVFFWKKGTGYRKSEQAASAREKRRCPTGFARSVCFHPGELKTFFSVFFLESNTDRNTRIFLGRGRGGLAVGDPRHGVGELES